MATPPLTLRNPNSYTTTEKEKLPEDTPQPSTLTPLQELHPYHLYFCYLQACQRINGEGLLLKPYCDAPISPLPDSFQGNWSSFLEKRYVFDLAQYSFHWNLGDLFKKLKLYFSRMFKGTETEFSGALFLAGKEFWEKNLCDGLMIDDLASEIKPEMWNFCTKQLPCELRFVLPSKFKTVDSKQIFERFIDLCFYFMALQSLENPGELSFGAEMGEFGFLLSPAIPDTPRAKQLKDLMQIMSSVFQKGIIMQDNLISSTSVRIPLGESHLRIIFCFSAHPRTGFYLKLSDEKVALCCNAPSPLQLLHDALLNRSKSPTDLGHLWAHTTEFGEQIHTKDQNAPNLNEAFNLGSEQITSGADQLLAYYFNAKTYAPGLHTSLKIVKEPKTPLGLFLFENLLKKPFEKVSAVIQLVFSMRLYVHSSASKALEPRLTRQGSLEIPFGAGYLVTPLDMAKSLTIVYDWLSTDREACLTCLTSALKLAFPHPDLIPTNKNHKQPLNEHHLQEIHHALPAEFAFLWFFGVMGAGWRKLPEDISLFYGLLESEGALQNLETIYQGKSLSPYFKSIREKGGTQNIFLETFLLSNDPKMVSQAWDICLKQPPEICFQILCNLCTQVNSETFNLLLSRVCTLSNPKSPLPIQDKIKLLSLYLERSTRHPKSIPISEAREVLFGYFVHYLQQEDVPVEPADLWQSIQETTGVPGQRISLFSRFHKIVLRSGKPWSDFVGVAGEFEKNLTSQTHVPQEFFEWLAEGLIQKGAYSLLASLLSKISPTKNLYQWYQKCLQNGIDQKASLETILPLLQCFPFQFAESPFLLTLFEYLITVQDPKVHPYLSLLKDRVDSATDTPRFLNCLLGYYPFAPVEELIEDITKNYRLFRRNHQELRLLPYLESILKAPITSEFGKLFKVIKSEEIFTNFVIESCEILATSLEGIQILKRDFSKFEKNLTPYQRIRLGIALATAARLSLREGQEREFLLNLTTAQNPAASLNWLLSLVKTEDTVESYAQLFLDFVEKGKIDWKDGIGSLIWISSRVPKSLSNSFIKGALSLPEPLFKKNLTIIGPALATFMATFPGLASPILNRLISHTESEERAFFKHCLTLQPADLEKRLKEFLKTWSFTVPSQPKKEPEPEKTMTWDAYFKELSPRTPTQLLEVTWKLWCKEHPLNQIKSEDGKQWIQFFEKCICEQENAAPIFDNLFLPNFYELFQNLNEDESKALLRLVLTYAINLCWKDDADPDSKRLRKVHEILQNKDVQTKAGDPVSQLTLEAQARLAILLASQKDETLYSSYKNFTYCFLGFLPENQEFNQHLISQFCIRPCAPFNDELRERVYRWLQISLSKISLNWKEATVVLKTLSLFPEKDSINIFYQWKLYVDKQKSKVQNRATEFITINSPMVAASTLVNLIRARSYDTPSDSFIEATHKLFKDLLEDKIGFQPKQALLFSIVNSLNDLEKTFFMESPSDGYLRFKNFWPYYIQVVLEEIPKPTNEDSLHFTPWLNSSISRDTLHIILDVLRKYLLPPRAEMDYSSFTGLLPLLFNNMIPILSACAIDTKVYDCTRDLLETILDSASLPLNKAHEWEKLILNLIGGIYASDKKNLRTMLRFGLRFLSQCMDSNRVFSIYHKTLAHLTSKHLEYFLSGCQLELLQPQELDDFFQNLSEEAISIILEQNNKALKTGDSDHLWAIVRVLCFTKAYSSKFLKNHISFFDQIYSIFPEVPNDETEIARLHLLFELRYAQAILAYIKKCQSFPKELKKTVQQLSLQFMDRIKSITNHITTSPLHNLDLFGQYSFDLHFCLLEIYRASLRLIPTDSHAHQLMQLSLIFMKDEESYKKYSIVILETAKESDANLIRSLLAAFQIPNDSDIKEKLILLKRILETILSKKV